MPKLFLCAAARQAACPNESQLNVVAGSRVTAAPAKRKKKPRRTSSTALRLQETCTDIRCYLPRFVPSPSHLLLKWMNSFNQLKLQIKRWRPLSLLQPAGLLSWLKILAHIILSHASACVVSNICRYFWHFPPAGSAGCMIFNLNIVKSVKCAPVPITFICAARAEVKKSYSPLTHATI